MEKETNDQNFLHVMPTKAIINISVLTSKNLEPGSTVINSK